jgi:hypothetical protein
VLEPVVARYRDEHIRRYFRGDAAFATPSLYDFLEEEKYLFAIRLPANKRLQDQIGHLLARPVGRPPKKPIVRYHSFNGELFPRVGFIVTNLRRSAEAVVRFYNGRGLAEQWIKEGKNALKWTRLSCHDFDDNQFRLHFFALAYSLGNFLRRLALPLSVSH